MPRRPSLAWRPGARLVAWLPPDWTAGRILAGLVLLVALVAGLAAPAVVSVLGLTHPSVHDPRALDLFGNPTGPSGAHPLGVDSEGRDVLSRILYGLRSMVLISLAGAALGVLVGGVLARLGEITRWRVGAVAAPVTSLVIGALRCFPAAPLGLGLGLALGPGSWRLIVAVGVSVIVPVRGSMPRREILGALAVAVRTALAIDFALTFLGDGPGGKGAQLGAMVARAGEGIVVGVPAWWALLFPGLLVMLVLAAALVLAPATVTPPSAVRLIRSPRTPLAYSANQIALAAVQAALVVLLALAMFASLAGANADHHAALAHVGSDLGATVSLLAGGSVVWGLATFIQLRLSTRRRWAPQRVSAPRRWVPRRLSGRRRAGRLHPVVAIPALLLRAAPAGWLAFLALYVFSDSVGKLPFLPGASSYVGLTHRPGRWAESLVMPWLLLGLGMAAGLAPAVNQRIAAEVRSGQQRVARAAGVPDATLRRQLRRALLAPLLELVGGSLPAMLGLAVVLEASFSIPGVGGLAVSGFGEGHAATVADVATLATLAVVLTRLILSLLRVLADPRAAQT